jgi:hypothetical protein
VHPQDDDEGKIFANSRSSLHLNVAACYQKMGEYRKSIDTCNKVCFQKELCTLKEFS